jgi:hypothetical protein
VQQDSAADSARLLRRMEEAATLAEFQKMQVCVKIESSILPNNLTRKCFRLYVRRWYIL